MNEAQFHKFLLITIAACGCAMLLIAVVFTWSILHIGNRLVDNGRYVQYDQQKDALVVQGRATHSMPQVLDTRNGEVRKVKQPER